MVILHLNNIIVFIAYLRKFIYVTNFAGPTTVLVGKVCETREKTSASWLCGDNRILFQTCARPIGRAAL